MVNTETIMAEKISKKGLKQLSQLGDQWLDQVNTTGLSSIVINKADLNAHLATIRLLREDLIQYLDHIKRNPHIIGVQPGISFAIMVIAINWAYFQEEDIGFVEPFTTEIRGRGNYVAWWNKTLGPIIEEMILSITHQRVAHGPYRYVGLIRKHAGIPLYKIDLVVALLHRLYEIYGSWEIVNIATKSELMDAASRIFGQSTYAAEFLKNDYGIEWLRSICSRLYYREQKLLLNSDLAQLPRGFNEILQRLDSVKTGGVKPKCPPKITEPEFFFIKDRCRFGLRFDPCDIKNHSIYVGSQQVRNVIFEIAELRRTCTITADNGNYKITIDGWIPGTGNWALFDIRGRFVAQNAQKNKLPAGLYYLVIDADKKLDEYHIRCCAECGWLDYDDVPYMTYIVELSPKSQLDGLEIYFKKENYCLSFESPAQQDWHKYAYEMDWILPDWVTSIKIKNWQPNCQTHIAAFCSFKGGLKRLAISATGNVDLSTIPSPSIGRLWIEAIGTGDKYDEVSFGRFPQCQICLPQRLLDEKENAEIIIIGSSFELQKPIDNAIDTINIAGNRIISQASFVQFRIVFSDDIYVNIGVLISRAKFRINNNRSKPIVISNQRLELIRNQFYNMQDKIFYLSAIPNKTITLWLRSFDNNADEKLVHILTRETKEMGSIRVISDEFWGAIRNCSISLGRFEVGIGNSNIPKATDSWFVNIENLENRPDTVSTQNVIPSALATILEIQSHAFSLDVKQTHILCPIVQSTLEKWLYATSIFDTTLLPGCKLKNCAVDNLKKLNRIAKLLTLEQQLDWKLDLDKGRRFLTLWDKINPIKLLGEMGLSSVSRWMLRLKKITAELATTTSVPRKLNEFITCAIETNNSSFERVPSRVIEACRLYFKAENQSSENELVYLNQAAQTINAESNNIAKLLPLWQQLAISLKMLIFLRCGEIDYFLKLWSESSQLSKTMAFPAGDFSFLASLLSNCSGDGRQCAITLAEVSPRRDDRSLAEAISRKDFATWMLASQTSWLNAWLGWRWCKSRGWNTSEQAIFIEYIQSNIDGCGNKTVKNKILNEIKK